MRKIDIDCTPVTLSLSKGDAVRGSTSSPRTTVIALLFFSLASFFSPPAHAATLLVDDFEDEDGAKNLLGNRCNVFIKAPSKAMLSQRKDTIEGKETQALMVRYDKRNTGGPYDSGGWCGFYTLLKSPPALVAPTPENPNPKPLGEQYRDGAAYKKITFWTRGEKGDENFVVGLSDRHWDKIGDSVKSDEIGKYLSGGKLTTQWQKASIPLDEYFLDYSQLASISVVFEGDLFPETGHTGTIYIDNIALE